MAPKKFRSVWKNYFWRRKMNVKRMIQMFAVILTVVVMSTAVQADMFAYWPSDEGEGFV
jgi:hypothetical protein